MLMTGPFRLLGECPTPWPCFVIAVRNEVLEKEGEAIQKILNIINETTQDFKAIPDIDKMISERYDQKLEDVQQWLSLTEWSQENLTENELLLVQEKLVELNLIDQVIPSEKILWK